MVLSPAQKLRPAVSPTPWALDEVAGRLVEISGSTASAALTAYSDEIATDSEANRHSRRAKRQSEKSERSDAGILYIA